LWALNIQRELRQVSAVADYPARRAGSSPCVVHNGGRSVSVW